MMRAIHAYLWLFAAMFLMVEAMYTSGAPW